MMDEKINVHIVTHTHWDREWYAPFEIFKSRLLTLVDESIQNMEKHPKFRHFMLDGQTVVLEDYLKARPENKEKLNELIRENKIIVGPWYVLPDEFLVTGEAMIRNFLIGQDVLKSLNLPSMHVGYLPDMFGHNAYTPTVLKGLDLKAAVIWRGVGDACRDTEFVWKSPNGDEMLTVNLIHSYSNGAHFGKNISKMKEVFSKEIKSLSNHKTTNNILIMNGTDHEFPLYGLPQKFSSWGKEFKVNLTHSTIENYVDNVVRENPPLKKVYGELKDPKYEPVLKDVTSTRIYLKLLNFEAQQLFTRYAEPLSAYLWMSGENINIEEEINQGWKMILKSQPHDSICGCSVDAVHRDVESRLRNSIELGSSLVAKYMREISKGLNVDSNIGLPILVFNPYEHERISITSMYVPSLANNSYELVDDKGKKYESVVESTFNVEREKTGPLMNQMSEKDHLKSLAILSEFQSVSTPWNLFFSTPKMLTFEAKLPPLGFKVFYLKKSKEEENAENISKEPDFENEFYTFHLNEDGSFDLKDKLNDVFYKSLNYFEDVADAGDEYNFSPIEGDKPITSLNQDANVVSIRDLGFFKKVEVEKKLELPKSLYGSRKLRTKEKNPITFHIIYKLYRDLSRIDVDLMLKNTVLDHKLSFVAKLPEKLGEVKNDGYFGLVSHPSDLKVYDDSYTEEQISRYAMESFVLLKGNKCKLLVATRGIHEYETHTVKKETKLNFTLLRSVGWLSRDDLKTRKDHAGPAIQTPEAQCIGEYQYHYSFVLLRKGDESEAYRMAKDFLLDPIAIEIVGEQEEKRAFDIPKFKFDEGSFLSALKISQDGKAVVARWVSHSDSESKVHIESPFNLKVESSNLAEKTEKEILTGKKIELNSIKKVETALIRLGRTQR